jgi:MOSC domain-containing protein YiiM
VPPPLSTFGHVEEILVSVAKGAPMNSVGEVQVHAARGLAGHHHKNLTLIEAEKIERFAEEYDLLFSAHDARRNIVTRGVELNPLLGREFHVGSVKLRALELCEPCSLLAKRTYPQVLPGLRHKGGLRCRIVSGGVIRVGDQVAVLPPVEFDLF